MDVVEFHAMGSHCRVVVEGGSINTAAECQQLVERLERTWSRFLPDSEISQVNAEPDRIHCVSGETYRLVETALLAGTATDGVFNPLMLTQLEDHGYSQPWRDGTTVPRSRIEPVSAEPIEIFPGLAAVRLPSGTRFDPGGIGKGLAADLATEFLIDRGATCSSVELGGDVRVQGRPWYGPDWRVGIVDPFDAERVVAAFTPEEGAVATSSRLGRQWCSGGQAMHHLLDPATGLPAETDLVTVSTCARTTAWAEVAAKAALIGGSDRFAVMLDGLGVPGVGVTEGGDVLTTDGRSVERRREQEVRT